MVWISTVVLGSDFCRHNVIGLLGSALRNRSLGLSLFLLNLFDELLSLPLLIGLLKSSDFGWIFLGMLLLLFLLTNELLDASLLFSLKQFKFSSLSFGVLVSILLLLRSCIILVGSLLDFGLSLSSSDLSFIVFDHGNLSWVDGAFVF